MPFTYTRGHNSSYIHGSMVATTSQRTLLNSGDHTTMVSL